MEPLLPQRTKLELVRGRFGFWWLAAGDPPLYYGPLLDQRMGKTALHLARIALAEHTDGDVKAIARTLQRMILRATR